MLVHNTAVIDFLATATQKHLEKQTVTKRTAVRLAIAEAIKEQILAPGDKLPPERDLVNVCGVSLGTVQAALVQLSNFDLIERRRGSGTIVKRLDENNAFGDHVWHFRFNSLATSRPLRILANSMQIDHVTTRPDLAQTLGASSKFLRVRRVFQMSESIQMYSEMFLHPDTARGLVERGTKELWVVNIRTFLEEEFGIKTVSSEHAVTVVPTPDVPFAEINAFDHQQWFKVTARVFDASRHPVYLQEIYARIDQCIPNFNSGLH